MSMDVRSGVIDEIFSLWVEMHMEVVRSVLIYMKK
jgi:hypothetical protein